MAEVGEDAAGQRLDNYLMKRLKGAPQSLIYRIIRSGEVRVNKGRAAALTKLALGDVVRIPPVRLEARAGGAGGTAGGAVGGAVAKRPASGQVRAGADLAIIFEDDALLAINKPSGLAVHGGSGVSFGVIEALRATRPDAKFLELVHRIDRDTSGVLLLAKKRSALVAMHALMREGKTDKRYFALVKGTWPHAAKHHIKTALAKYTTGEGERRVAEADDGEYAKEAHTIVSVVKRFGAAATADGARAPRSGSRAGTAGHADDATAAADTSAMTLVEAQIKTGRTHQIRVHLASAGYPIAGDDKYGDFAFNKTEAKHGLKRMFLHAAKMGFVHPLTAERIRIEAPLPAECEHYLARFGKRFDKP